MSFSPLPQQPPSGLNAEAGRVEQRRLDDLAARAARSQHPRPATRESVHRMVARVRAVMRTHPRSR